MKGNWFCTECGRNINKGFFYYGWCVVCADKYLNLVPNRLLWEDWEDFITGGLEEKVSVEAYVTKYVTGGTKLIDIKEEK